MYKYLYLLLFLSVFSNNLEIPHYNKIRVEYIQEVKMDAVIYPRHNNTIRPKIATISKTDKLIHTAKTYLGVRYVWGGNNRQGIDCSGFVKVVFNSEEINLPRTSGELFNVGKKVNKRRAKKGDLIFFSDSKRKIGHVGIIIDPKRKLMIHASSGAHKVTISNYGKKYYITHYKGVRRVS